LLKAQIRGMGGAGFKIKKGFGGLMLNIKPPFKHLTFSR
jgi:hypothetical protein